MKKVTQAEDAVYYAIKHLMRLQENDKSLTKIIKPLTEAHQFIKKIMNEDLRGKMYNAGMLLANCTERDLYWVDCPNETTEQQIIEGLEATLEILKEKYQ